MKDLLCICLLQLSTILFGSPNDSIQSSLVQLDECLSHQSEYENDKLMRTQILKEQLDYSTSLTEQYRLVASLYEEYKLYKYDSAYFYAEKMIDLAHQMNDRNKIIESQILMAYCCLNAGLFKESDEIAKQIDADALDIHHRIVLYSFFAKLNLDMSASIGVEPYRTKYTQECIRYSQLIIDMIGKDNPESYPYFVNIYRCRKDYPQAINTIQVQLASTSMDERRKSLNIGGLGQFYLLMGDTINALPYLCYAAVADIKAVIKETPALCMLAEVTYNEGDLKHAYTYAQKAFDDANFYKARHRKIEVGNVLPIIERSRFDIIDKQNKHLLYFAILVSLLFILFLVSTIVIFRQMKQLKQARRLNKKQNKELLRINKKLKEADHIKNGYIGYFFSVNSAYIDKIETFQKLVSRKIMSRQYDELPKLFKSEEIQKERENMFSTFDQIFLRIFPNFIGQVNDLLKEEYRISLKSKEVLTPEMRIFALIRLGIADAEKIAKFLNYSVNTINTYKTKIKNRSIVPNEQFEQKIMEIESVKTETF